VKVRPFNGERRNKWLAVKTLSWSHGFTHFRTEAGQVGYCGTAWFEEHAEAV
jgi:hypothetical protein